MSPQFDDPEAAWQEHVGAAREADEEYRKRVALPFYPLRYALKVGFNIAGLAAVLYVLWMTIRIADAYLIPFSPQAWKAAGQSSTEVGKRGRMVRRLERQYRLIGMKRAEIVEMLGEPKEDYNDWDMAYSIGRSHMPSMAGYYFVLRTDKSKVTAYDIVSEKMYD